MAAKVIPLSDLAKAVDEALIRALGTGRPGGPIILGRVVKKLEGNPATVARKVTAEIAPKLQGLKLTPTTFLGKDGTTIGFVLRAPIEK